MLPLEIPWFPPGLEKEPGCQSIIVRERKVARNVPGRNKAVIKVNVDIEMLSSFVDVAILRAISL